MSKNFKTFLKHTAKDYYNQSVNPPVVRASTIIFKSMDELRKTQAKGKKNPIGGHFDYGRQGTSTTYILQKMLKEMGMDEDNSGMGNSMFGDDMGGDVLQLTLEELGFTEDDLNDPVVLKTLEGMNIKGFSSSSHNKRKQNIADITINGI